MFCVFILTFIYTFKQLQKHNHARSQNLTRCLSFPNHVGSLVDDVITTHSTIYKGTFTRCDLSATISELNITGTLPHACFVKPKFAIPSREHCGGGGGGEGGGEACCFVLRVEKQSLRRWFFVWIIMELIVNQLRKILYEWSCQSCLFLRGKTGGDLHNLASSFRLKVAFQLYSVHWLRFVFWPYDSGV